MGIAIVDDALKIPTLTQDVAEQLRKTQEYLTFCIRITDAMENSDDEETENISIEYSDWWNANPTQLEGYGFYDPLGWPDIMILWTDEGYNPGPNNNY
jgi:hypothetical protein